MVVTLNGQNGLLVLLLVEVALKQEPDHAQTPLHLTVASTVFNRTLVMLLKHKTATLSCVQLMEVTLSGLHGACVQGLVEVDPTPEQDLAQHQLLTVWDKLASNKVWDQQAKQSYATHSCAQLTVVTHNGLLGLLAQ
jgi:hypothetical protein